MQGDEPMIERVARALHEADQAAPAAHDYDRHLKFMARAAIETMREPTSAMLEAHGGRGALYDWQAMIDAALAEG